MKITLKFVSFFMLITFVASLYLCWIDYHFIYGNLSMWPTQDTLTLIELTFFLGIIISAILWKLLKSYDNAIKRILNGEILSKEERIKTMNCYNKTVIVIIIANALGFFIGKIVMTVLLISRFPEMNAKALGNLSLGFIQSIMIGIVAALYESLVLNIMMAKTRKLLKIRNNSEFGKSISISLTGKIIIVSLASFVFIGCNSFLSSFFIVSKEAEALLPSYYAKGFEAFLFTFIPCTALLLIITKSAKERIKETSKLVQGFGEKGDLESRIDLSMKDDFSFMLSKLNGFLDNLSILIHNIKTESSKATAITNELKKSMDNSRIFLSEMHESIQVIFDGNQEQDKQIEKATNNVSEMEKNAHLVESQIALQSDAVMQSSSAVSQMVSNIHSVTGLTEKANDCASTLKDSTSTGTDSLSQAVHAITEIKNVSEEIAETMKIIQKIASQTNLLSMNAAIEAAHAGDFGAGFAIVADEVRNLANSSANSAKSIQNLIKSMIEKVRFGVESINQAGSAFENITSNIDKTTKLIEDIAGSMEEQSEGASNTLNATKAVNLAINEIKDLSHAQTKAARDMALSFQSIVDTSVKVTDALLLNSDKSATLYESIDSVGTQIDSTSDAMNKIEDQISVFKLANEI